MRYSMLLPFFCFCALQANAGRLPLALPEGPLAFEANQGRADERCAFLSRGAGYSLLLGAGGGRLLLFKGASFRQLKFSFPGSNPEAKAETEACSGAGCARVRVRGLYPGVDLVYAGEGGKLSLALELGPQAGAGGIAMAFEGAKALSMDPGGSLAMELGGKRVAIAAPSVRRLGRELKSRCSLKGPLLLGIEFESGELALH